MEYEQTVQTLRNWDTLFFNVFSSLVIGGGIAGVAALATTDKVQNISLILIGFETALFLVILMYVLYNKFVASEKFKVLMRIEKELGLVGAYRQNQEKTKSVLNYILFPLLTSIYLLAVLITHFKFA